LDGTDQALLDEVRQGFASVGALYDQVKLKAALSECRRLSQRVNQYLNDKAPWQSIKSDPAGAGTSIYVALQAIDWLKLLWAPILPHSSQQLHGMLGYEGRLFGRQYTEEVADERGTHLVLRYDGTEALGRWEAGTLRPGQALQQPEALFVKLEDDVAIQEAEAAAG
jgi:methionyl-tRNA synthetase